MGSNDYSIQIRINNELDSSRSRYFNRLIPFLEFIEPKLRKGSKDRPGLCISALVYPRLEDANRQPQQSSIKPNKGLGLNLRRSFPILVG